MEKKNLNSTKENLKCIVLGFYKFQFFFQQFFPLYFSTQAQVNQLHSVIQHTPLIQLGSLQKKVLCACSKYNCSVRC